MSFEDNDTNTLIINDQKEINEMHAQLKQLVNGTNLTESNPSTPENFSFKTPSPKAPLQESPHILDIPSLLPKHAPYNNRRNNGNGNGKFNNSNYHYYQGGPIRYRHQKNANNNMYNTNNRSNFSNGNTYIGGNNGPDITNLQQMTLNGNMNNNHAFQQQQLNQILNMNANNTQTPLMGPLNLGGQALTGFNFNNMNNLGLLGLQTQCLPPLNLFQLPNGQLLNLNALGSQVGGLNNTSLGAVNMAPNFLNPNAVLNNNLNFNGTANNLTLTDNIGINATIVNPINNTLEPANLQQAISSDLNSLPNSSIDQSANNISKPKTIGELFGIKTKDLEKQPTARLKNLMKMVMRTAPSKMAQFNNTNNNSN